MTGDARARALGALERVVYCLDRSLAPSPKVRAFVRARDIVAELADDELERLVAAGRHTELEGIGASTGEVIAAAVTGRQSTYLAELEARSTVPLGAGAPLRAALRGDCHTHTTWSDGGASLEAMAAAAAALGHEYLVVTDHSARLTVAHGLSEERLLRQLDEIAALNERLAPFRLLTGIEVDIFEDGSLDLADHLLARLDVVVASVHSKFTMPAPEMTRRLVLAAVNPHVDILGHLTNRKVVGRGRPPSVFDAEIVCAACVEYGTAIEINCRPERQDPPDDILALAVEWGCTFAIDTDAHAPGQLEWQNFGCDRLAPFDVAAERILNTRTADQLLAATG